jgi:hypothetical protein
VAAIAMTVMARAFPRGQDEIQSGDAFINAVKFAFIMRKQALASRSSTFGVVV